jgi:EF-hand domain pair
MYRFALTVGVLAGIASPALAQETRESAAAKFKLEFAESDTNHDGVLTRNEVQARMAGMRTAKGKIDPVHAKRLADLWFKSADKNGDGKVTESEAQALLAATFDRYDANRDGRLGPTERDDARRSLRQ